VTVSLKYFAARKSATQLTHRLLNPVVVPPISDETFHYRTVSRFSFAAFVGLAFALLALLIFR
jgi:hypothetical protein